MSPNVLERLRATDSALKAKDCPAKPEGWGGGAKPEGWNDVRPLVGHERASAQTRNEPDSALFLKQRSKFARALPKAPIGQEPIT